MPPLPSLQWEIIQGRDDGKLFEPSGLCNVLRDFPFDPPEQQAQPGPCVAVIFGLSADRSLVA